MPEKNFVIHTSVIVHDPYFYENFGKNNIIIPAIVLEELEDLKKKRNEKSQSADEFLKNIMQMREEYNKSLAEPIPLPSGGTIRIELNNQNFRGMSDFHDKKNNDNRFLAVAKNIQESSRKETSLVSNYSILIAKADAMRIKAELYDYDRLVNSADDIHTGKHIFSTYNQDVIDDLYKTGQLPIEELEKHANFISNHQKPKERRITKRQDFYINDFVIIKNENTSQSAVGQIKSEGNTLVLKPLVRENFSYRGLGPKNIEQKMFMEMLLDPNIDLVIAFGEAGSGKTFMTLLSAIYMLKHPAHYGHNSLSISRPTTPMTESLGALPGNLQEKLNPWNAPFYDNLKLIYKKEMEKVNLSQEMIDENEPLSTQKIKHIVRKEGFIEFDALMHYRGRTKSDEIIFVDEFPNLTPRQGKTVITRAGINSKLILTGDIKQIDNHYLDEINNALTYTIERMKVDDKTGILFLEETVRSSLAERGVKYL